MTNSDFTVLSTEKSNLSGDFYISRSSRLLQRLLDKLSELLLNCQDTINEDSTRALIGREECLRESM